MPPTFDPAELPSDLADPPPPQTLDAKKEPPKKPWKMQDRLRAMNKIDQIMSKLPKGEVPIVAKYVYDYGRQVH